MKKTKGKKFDPLFSSKSVEWETPQDVFDEWDLLFGFELDVCATKQNKKCVEYFDRKVDGLTHPWNKKVCWMNPPYGRGLTGKWVKKAYEETKAGAIVVALLPARTDTKWFHQYCLSDICEVTFLPGRLKFVGAKHSAPFPSMIAIFQGGSK